MLPQVVTYLPGLRPLSTMELYTDTYYIQRIQAGDVACFACLLDKYSRPIHSLILKVVRSQEEAEELAQDTFMKVFKNLASFKGDCSFSTWIYRIAYNTAISSVRKKRYEFLAIEETTLENVSEEEITNLFGQTESTEQVQRLEVALEQLLPDERALILLFYWKEKTIEELVSIPDLLGDLFKRIPEEELPASFRSNVMRQIMLESAKAKKRDERFSLLAAIVASLIMISLAIVSFVYMEIPKIAIPTISTSALAFYLYIGAITLILLLADYKLRNLFHKKG